jgi:hypothetical protein
MNGETLLTFIERVERAHFRTVEDTGSNLNALLIWNAVREHAGLPRISRDDLARYDETTGRYVTPEGSKLLGKSV